MVHVFAIGRWPQFTDSVRNAKKHCLTHAFTNPIEKIHLFASMPQNFSTSDLKSALPTVGFAPFEVVNYLTNGTVSRRNSRANSVDSWFVVRPIVF